MNNIFWFIIDSVRTFRTGEDDRDRIDIMDTFSKDSIEFTNCYTSAPSSLLAAGAMFSGLPSVFISRHFNDWKFDVQNISILKTLVEEHGYTSIPLIDGRNAREKYRNLLSSFPSSYLPKGKYLRDYGWNNEEVTEIFEHIIKTKPFSDPFAFVFWYDCRRDPNTSKHVEKAINLIKEHGYYDDSIIAMHSDHGYPDPRTKLNESFFKGMGHDMILTDDNVKTPLFLKYPGSPSNIKISHTVGHVDIIPTMFDVLNIPMNKANDSPSFKGKSLKPIIEGKEDNERCVRIDTRLQMDTDRITAYRKGDYKFIYFQDDNSSLLYDLKNDQLETQDLSKNNDYISVLNDFETIHDSRVDAYIAALREAKVNLVVSGSESHLVTPIGLGAIIRGAGIPFLGASPRAAALEGSKILTRRILDSAGVPQPNFEIYEAGDFAVNRDAAMEYGREKFADGVEGLVVKADGLCGGKGVKVCRTYDEFKEGINRLEQFGDSGKDFLIEELLEGAEISGTAVVGANRSYQLLSFAQDYKLSGEGDTGSMTGGMGAVTVDLPHQFKEYIKRTIVEPTIKAAEDDKRSMEGAVVYFGLMLTEDGPKVLEINMRMGDPETQVIVPSYSGKFGELLYDAATGQDVGTYAGMPEDHFATVCLAAKGYPDDKALQKASREHAIFGLKVNRSLDRIHFIGGGIKRTEGGFFPNGTRVLYALGIGGTQQLAIERAYQGVAGIKCEGLFHRDDIGCNLAKINKIVEGYEL